MDVFEQNTANEKAGVIAGFVFVGHIARLLVDLNYIYMRMHQKGCANA